MRKFNVFAVLFALIVMVISSSCNKDEITEVQPSLSDEAIAILKAMPIPLYNSGSGQKSGINIQATPMDENLYVGLVNGKATRTFFMSSESPRLRGIWTVEHALDDEGKPSYEFTSPVAIDELDIWAEKTIELQFKPNLPFDKDMWCEISFTHKSWKENVSTLSFSETVYFAEGGYAPTLILPRLGELKFVATLHYAGAELIATGAFDTEVLNDADLIDLVFGVAPSDLVQIELPLKFGNLGTYVLKVYPQSFGINDPEYTNHWFNDNDYTRTFSQSDGDGAILLGLPSLPEYLYIDVITPQYGVSVLKQYIQIPHTDLEYIGRIDGRERYRVVESPDCGSAMTQLAIAIGQWDQVEDYRCLPEGEILVQQVDMNQMGSNFPSTSTNVMKLKVMGNVTLLGMDFSYAGIDTANCWVYAGTETNLVRNLDNQLGFGYLSSEYTSIGYGMDYDVKGYVYVYVYINEAIPVFNQDGSALEREVSFNRIRYSANGIEYEKVFENDQFVEIYAW